MCAGTVGRAAAGIGLSTQPQPGTWQYTKRQTGVAQHDQLIMRPADWLSHLRVSPHHLILRHEQTTHRRHWPGVQPQRREKRAQKCMDQVINTGNV